MTAAVDIATEPRLATVPRLGHHPALDGVRGVAVLLVVAYHLKLPHSPRGGSIGVTTFFVLSGFLITSLLLTEAAGTGRVRLPAFYARRALRLLPALLVLVPVVTGWALLAGRRDGTVAAVPAVLLYVGNWVRAGGGTLGAFEHTWSLAVEEQFYLLWPLVVVAAGALAGARRRPLAVLVAALAGSAASLAYRVHRWDVADPAGSAVRLYTGTDAAADQLLLGCALAAALHLTARAGRDLRATTRVLRVAGPAALVFLLWVATERPGGTSVANNRLYLTWGATAFAAAAAVLVAHVVTGPGAPLPRLLATRPLTAVGRVSYGLYLWHYPVILAVDDRLPAASPPTRWVIAVAVTAAVTALSWYAVERPALRQKRRVAPGARAAPGAPPGHGRAAAYAARP